ncbi:hypothetical protein D3C86_2065890 [compost metagenome]
MIGLPAININMIGFPVFCNSAINFSCRPGKLILALECASPERIASSPAKNKITSDFLASAIADANPSSDNERLCESPDA